MSNPIGLGEAVGKYLPNIVKNVRSLFDPTGQAESELFRAIQQNPKLAQNLAEMQADNPDILTPFYGKDATAAISQVKPSLEFQNKRAMQQAQSDLTPEQIQESVFKTLGIKGEDEKLKDRLELTNLQNQVKLGTMSLEDQERKNKDISRIRTTYGELSNEDLYKRWKSGAIATKDWELIAELSPKTMEQVWKRLDDERDFERARTVAAINQKNGRNDLLFQWGLSGIQKAKTLGVNPGDYLVATMGKDIAAAQFPQFAASSTAEGVKLTEGLLKQERNQELLKGSRDFLAVYNKLASKDIKLSAKQGIVDEFNALAQSRGNPIRAKIDPGGFFGIGGGVKYYAGDKEIQPGEVSSALGNEVSQSITPSAPADEQVKTFATDLANQIKSLDTTKKRALIAKLDNQYPEAYAQALEYLRTADPEAYQAILLAANASEPTTVQKKDYTTSVYGPGLGPNSIK